jgi:MFS family permease
MNTRPERGIYRYYVLALLTLSYLLSYMDRQILSILIEDIGLEFSANGRPMSDMGKGLLMGPAFGMFYATLGVPVAMIADNSSRKNIVAGAITLWSAATAACAAATGFSSLFVARMMVGVGEAGGTAPAHSLLSDYFRKTEISRAIAVFSLGTVLGATIALMAGGLIADLTSWRLTFVIAAIPGVICGALIFFTVREPERGRFETQAIKKQRISFTRALPELFSNKAYVGTILSHAFAVFMGYVITSWGAALFIRNFEISKTEVGLILGPAIFLGGLPGMMAGGYLSDMLSRRDARWMGWIPSIGCFLCIPVFLAALFIGGAVPMAILFGFGIFVFNIAHAPSLGIIQTVVRPNLRATGAAFAFLLSNVFGLIIGPPLAGWISQQLKPAYGTMSLNYAFALLLTAMLIAGLGFFWTALQLKDFEIEGETPADADLRRENAQ